jgi:hypothetical protein
MKFHFPLVALLFTLLSAASAQDTIPDNLKPPAGEKLILEAHATGFQIYTCQAGSDGKLSWTLKAPDADLSDSQNNLIGHHFAGPTWKHKDGSEVTGKMTARADSPDPVSIPWLLLTATGHSGEGVLTRVTTIQRIHTKGGQAPAANKCDVSHRGAESKAHYTADYYFYAPAK